MIKKLYLPLVALLVLALSSCGKMGELSSDYFTTNPEVLEAIGGKVPVTINGKFPEKYFKKNATVEVTPVLRWKGGEAKGQPAVFQGEKVEGNNQTIAYKAVGCDVIRCAVPDMPAAQALREIVAQSPIPVIADIHFDYKLALAAIDAGVNGLRLNPGNIGGREKVEAVVAAARIKNIPIRIGVNAGSLPKDLLEKYGHPTAEALVEAAWRDEGVAERSGG